MSGALLNFHSPKFASFVAGRIFNASGSAGARRLTILAVAALAVGTLIVVVAATGRHAPSNSRDARMKHVDPLPGASTARPSRMRSPVRPTMRRPAPRSRKGYPSRRRWLRACRCCRRHPRSRKRRRRTAPGLDQYSSAVPHQRRNPFPSRSPSGGLDVGPVGQGTRGAAGAANSARGGDPKAEEAYSKQIGDLFSQWGGRTPHTDIVLPPSGEDGAGTSGDGGESRAPAGATSRKGSPAVPAASHAADPVEILIPAGRCVYAHPILTVNSDASSPVVMQADSGPIAGDRMIGTFAKQAERLVIRINTVIHQGQSIGTDGVVVALETMEAGVASDVDQHYMARLILPAAAAFAQGLGRAIATTSNTAAVLSPFGGAAYTTHLNLSQQLGVAAGAAAGQVGAVLNQAAPKGSTVSLEANVAVGVMFLSNVTMHRGS